MGRKSQLLFNNKGQAAIEYLVVCLVLITALIKAPAIYDTLSGVMKNKYHSYSFGVAISDPPRKAFDDALTKDANKILSIFDVLKEIEDDIENVNLPDPDDLKLPSWDNIKKFGDETIEKIKNL